MQIGGRVAVHGQHLLPVEDVVAEPVLGEVGILDGAQADDLGHPGPGFRVEVGAVLIDDLARLGDGLVEQRFQADDVSFSGLERPAVGAQDRAEGDVLEVDLVVPPPPSDREELLEMVALAVIDHVENLLGDSRSRPGT